MAIASGSHQLGPESGSLVVKTYREGVASRAGHDLVIEVTRWQATVDVAPDPGGWTVELSANAGSLEVREGLGGVKPLTDKDRREILKTIDEKVLLRQPITFRSSALRAADGDRRLFAEGDLTIAGSTRLVRAQLEVDP